MFLKLALWFRQRKLPAQEEACGAGQGGQVTTAPTAAPWRVRLKLEIYRPGAVHHEPAPWRVLLKQLWAVLSGSAQQEVLRH